MTFSSNAFHFIFVLTAACNAVTSATDPATATVDLGTAGDFAILTKTGITTVPNSVITGDIGVSPISAASMTGFSFTEDSSGDFSMSTQVDGRAYASDFETPIPAKMTTAVSDMETAYTDAAGRANADAARINFGAGILGGDFGGPATGKQLTTGIYTFDKDVLITDPITFKGSATDIFIIQIAGNLVQDANVVLLGGAKAENIFWQVAGYVDVATGAHLEGVLLVKTKAVFKTGSSLNGRVLAQTECTLDQVTIVEPPVVVD